MLVSICCLAYNHAAYIRECLDGFLMQRTDFPVEIIVHDDASTDGTQDILREYQARYPDRFHLILQTENQYSKGVNVAIQYIFPQVRGKYIAFCEGDDYWTDPDKLQKQVDFLEAHPDHSMCCHLTPMYLQVEKRIIERDLPRPIADKNDVSFSLSDWLSWGYFFQTSSVLARAESLDVCFLSSFKMVKDLHTMYSLLERGNGYFMKEAMSVYRVHDAGIWSGLSFEKQRITALTDACDIYRERRNKVTRNWLIANFGELILYYIRKEKRSAKAFGVLPRLIKHCGWKGLFDVSAYIRKKIVNRYFTR